VIVAMALLLLAECVLLFGFLLFIILG